MDNRGKMLVIRGGSISDFILTLPVFAKLREYFPNVELETLASPHIAQLALAGGLVDKVRPIHTQPLAQFFARNARLDESLADYFSEFDVIFSYLFDPDQIFETNVCRCTPAQFIPGLHRPDESISVHASEIFLKPLERLAIFDSELFVPIKIKSENGLSLHPGKWIALHPGGETEAWPEECWSLLISRFVESSEFSILLVGTEMEGERLDRLGALVPDGRLKVVRNYSLVDLAKTMSGCCGYLGQDSGISHLASALELKGVILWNDKNLDVWKPQNPDIGIVPVERESVDRRVERVWEMFGSLCR